MTARAPTPGSPAPPRDASGAVEPAPSPSKGAPDDPTRPDLTARVLKPALIYIQRTYGREELSRFVRATGLELSYLENENNWISLGYQRRFLEALVARTGNPRAAYDAGMHAATKEAYGSLFYFLLAFGSPSLVYRKFVEIASLVSKVGKFELEELSHGRARIRYRILPPNEQDALNCESIKGQLASIPTVWQLPPAVIEERSCQARGCEACVYEIRWVDHPPVRRGFVGAIAGALLAGASISIWGLAPGPIVASALQFVAFTGCGYFLGRAFDYRAQFAREAEANQGRSAALLSSLHALERQHEELRRANDEVRRHARRLAAFNRLGTELSRSLDLDRLFETIVRVMVEDLGFTRSAIFLLDEERSVLSFKSGWNVPGHVALKLRQADIPLGSGGKLDEACARGDLVVGDGARDGASGEDGALAELLGASPFVIAPLKKNGRVIGAVTLTGTRTFGNLHSEDDFLAALGTQIMTAIENAYSYEAVGNIVRSLPVPLAIVDRDERVEFANAAFERLFGLDDQALAGRTLCDALRLEGEQVRRLRAEARLVRRRKGPRDGETRHEGRLLEYRLFLLSRTAGTRHRIGVLLKDATADREFQRRLLQAEKLAGIGTLASGVAHEINNPLSAILGHAEAIEDAADLDLAREHGRKIADYAGMAGNIVRELARYNRSAQAAHEDAEADVNAAIEEALKLARHSTEMSGMAVTLDLAPDAPPVRGSAVEIQQTVVNLAINAAHATGGRGRLRVATAARDGAIEVSVDDDGPGVPEHLRSRLFEPFFTTKETGTGLGLYVVYRIMQKHGGSVTIESSPDLGGARFVLRFPAGRDRGDGE